MHTLELKYTKVCPNTMNNTIYKGFPRAHITQCPKKGKIVVPYQVLLHKSKILDLLQEGGIFFGTSTISSNGTFWTLEHTVHKTTQPRQIFSYSTIHKPQLQQQYQYIIVQYRASLLSCRNAYDNIYCTWKQYYQVHITQILL